jgi:hypothetical protein
MPEHAALITTLILERPMCLQCLTAKAGMTGPSVRSYLEQISKAVNLQQSARERCQACGTVGPVVSIGRKD